MTFFDCMPVCWKGCLTRRHYQRGNPSRTARSRLPPRFSRCLLAFEAEIGADPGHEVPTRTGVILACLAGGDVGEILRIP